MQNTDNKTINAKEIFTAEKELFEITQMIDYTQLEKNQQKELKDNLNRGYYKKFIYDVNLNKDVINNYKIHQKLYQPTEIYLTDALTKPLKNTRYLIYSKEFQEIPKGNLACVYQDMKIFTLGIINCFKIINIKTQKNMTQITLLHYNIFEELLLNHQKTKIEKKIEKESEKPIETSTDNSTNDFQLNYKIETGIGLYENKNKIEHYTKDQVIYILKLYIEILEKFNVEKIYEILEKYNVSSLIKVYENSINHLKKMSVDENTDYKQMEENVTNACIDTVINTLEISKNLESNVYEKEDISSILAISEDKLDEIIDLNKN